VKDYIMKIAEILSKKDLGLPDDIRGLLEELIVLIDNPKTFRSGVHTCRTIMEWFVREIYCKLYNVHHCKLGNISIEKMLRILSEKLSPNNQEVIKILQGIGNRYAHAYYGMGEINPSIVKGSIEFCLVILDFYFEDFRLLQNIESSTALKSNSAPLKPLLIGVDVGTTKIAVGLVDWHDDEHPTIIHNEKVLHQEIGSEIGIIDKIEGVIHSTLNKSGVTMKDIDGVGIGLPGQVDARTGLLKFAPGLRLKNINVCTNLKSRLNVPVFANNDVKCSTLAELHFGHGKVFSNFVCVFVGTGIGAGIVINNELFNGKTFSAGEIGHLKIDCGENARACTCGSKGCFEEYASARAIVRLAREKIFEFQERKIDNLLSELDPSTVTTYDIVQAIKKQDKSGIELARQIAYYLSIGIANVANFINPEAIILGGGIIEGFYAFDFFNSIFIDSFRERTLNVCSNTEILLSTHKSNAPIIGASLSAFNDWKLAKG